MYPLCLYLDLGGHLHEFHPGMETEQAIRFAAFLKCSMVLLLLL